MEYKVKYASMLFLRRKFEWRIPALLGALTIFFNWKVLFTSKRMIPWDAVDFFYPYLAFIHEELRHFRLPLWDPYVMSGFPIIADPEAQIFYPLNWLFVLLHPFGPMPYRLVEIQIVFHFFLAGLFMYYLAKTFVTSTFPALLAALLYEFGGGLVVHAEHMASVESMAWYPLVFLLARRGLLEKNVFLTISAGVAFGLQILTGHAQHTVYLGLLLFLYFSYEACFGANRHKLWPYWIWSLTIIAVVGASLGLIQIIPSIELANHSIRSYLLEGDVVAGNDPRYLWTLFLPNMNGGINGSPKLFPFEITFNYVFLTVPGCLFALLGIWEMLRRKNFFWLALVLLSIELSMGQRHYLGSYLFHVPVLNLFRNAGTFFDLAHFALCLLAAIGAESLLSRDTLDRFKNYLSYGLGALLISVITIGEFFHFREHILGWSVMLAVLNVFVLVASAFLLRKIGSPVLQWVVIGLIGFQLIHYNMNQEFNAAGEHPELFVGPNIAATRKETIEFFRSDLQKDFRVGAVAETPYSGNGGNVWRVPVIYGWNPITLRKYDEYIRGFSNSGNYTLPYGGPDHNFHSSMFDLLGTKYLLLVDADLQEKLNLKNSNKFQLAFSDYDFWKTYRNNNYLSHAWFFPRATVVPDREVSVGLMGSAWFDGRKRLLVENGSLSSHLQTHSDDVSVISLNSDLITELSTGYRMVDPYCPGTTPMLGGWAEKKDDWLRYDLQGPNESGRYLLLMKYTAVVRPTPTLDVSIENGSTAQNSGPFILPGTSDWRCDRSRIIELGTFDLAPGKIRMTVTSRVPSDIHMYTFWLVKLPSSEPVMARDFSFTNFSISANKFSFDSQQQRDGFVLLNEIDYPGWTAEVDGQPAEIIPADHIFRSVYVPAGSHHIEYRFWPRHFLWGALISLLTLLGYILFVAAERRKRHPEST